MGLVMRGMRYYSMLTFPLYARARQSGVLVRDGGLRSADICAQLCYTLLICSEALSRTNENRSGLSSHRPAFAREGQSREGYSLV